MSKAFVREDDMPDESPPMARASPLPPGAKNYLTAAGAKRLRAEHDRLLQEERPRLANRDDKESRQELQKLDQRIRYLAGSLRSAEVVSPSDLSPGVVRFGATVTVRETQGAESQYRLVGVDEADPARNEVSWLSPLAQALLNARLGQKVGLTTPKGRKELEIVRITYES